MIDNNRVELSDSGELIVTLRSGYDTTFKITSWSDGLQFYTLNTDANWLLEESDAGIIFSTAKSCNYKGSGDAVERFVEVIPSRFRQAVAVFSHRQFSLLRLAAQYPNLRELLIRSPNLCWLVICFAEQANWSQKQVVQLLQLKRVCIVERLFANKSMQLVKLINKIQLVNGSEGEAKLLFKLLKKTQIVDGFNHWQSVSIITLRVVSKRPYFMNSKLLANEIDICKTKQANVMHFFDISQIYDDLHRMHNALNKVFEPRVWRSIESFTCLRQLHDRWVVRYNKIERRRLAVEQARPADQAVNDQAVNAQPINRKPYVEVDYPICAIGDRDDLIQIKNSTELSLEGVDMSHCVGSYGDKLMRGDSYIYKLLQPQRATVEIKVRGNRVSILQFKLAHNHKPSPDTCAHLRSLIAGEN